MFKKSDIQIGAEISCEIEGKTIKSGKIQIENRLVYICQNEKAGTICKDKQGYNYSWSVANIGHLPIYSVEEFFGRTNVRHVHLIKAREWDSEVNYA